MNIQWKVFAAVLIINALVALVLALLVGMKRYAPGSRSIVMMFLALAIWTFSYAMITLSPGMDSKILWLKIENIGITTTAAFWFFFTADYTQNNQWLTRPVRFLFFIIPLTTLVFLFSGVWFNFYYTSALPQAGGPLTITGGFWYPFQLVQTYGLLLAGFGLLLWHMIRLRDIYRRQITFVLLGLAIPLVANIFYQLHYITVDIAPIAFLATAILMSIGVIGLRMFDLVPIARNVVIENIPEMVLVVDAYNRVLDLNRTAEAWLRKPAREILGQDVMKAFSLWPGLAGRFRSSAELREEIEVAGNPPRILELLISPLYNTSGDVEGRAIVARDITNRKTMETELLRTNQALKARIAEVDALRARLQEQIIRDPLTGLYNRRHLTIALDEEVERAHKKDSPLAIAVIDLDYFKKFNDTYGHKCGDAVLLSFAKLLSSKLRNGEIACRYGGEEFVVVMPGIALEAALERAEDWRQSLETKIFEYNGQTLFHATMSVGIAVLPLHGQDSESILQAADQALYHAKDHGRNQVTVYQPASSPADQEKDPEKE